MFEKIEKLQVVSLGLILALGLIFAVNVATKNVSNDKISVTGSAFKIVQSDSARLEFDIEAKRPTKQLAYSLVQTQLPIVKKYLADNGIKDIEIKATNGYNTYKYSSNGSMTNDLAYYTLSQPIVVKSDDVNKIQQISTDIQNLLNQGIDIGIISTEYYYSKLGDLKVELLEDATKDAKDRASAMLKATKNRPGKIQSVQMGVFQITPVDSTNVSDMGINDTSSIEKKVTAVANVVFRIK